MGDSYREALKKTAKRVRAEDSPTGYRAKAAKRAAFREQHDGKPSPKYHTKDSRQMSLF